MNIERSEDAIRLIEILKDKIDFGLAPSEEEMKLVFKILDTQTSKIEMYEKIIRERRHIILD